MVNDLSQKFQQHKKTINFKEKLKNINNNKIVQKFTNECVSAVRIQTVGEFF